jgi:hypothetical protein
MRNKAVRPCLYVFCDPIDLAHAISYIVATLFASVLISSLICKHPECYMCMYLLRFSFNTLILGYKIIKFIGYVFQ